MLDMGFIHDIRRILEAPTTTKPPEPSVQRDLLRRHRSARTSRAGFLDRPRVHSRWRARAVPAEIGRSRRSIGSTVSSKPDRRSSKLIRPRRLVSRSSSSREPSTAPIGWAEKLVKKPESRRELRFTATRAKAPEHAPSPTSSSGRIRALVATDIAARGLDIDKPAPRRQLRDARTCPRTTSTASAGRPRGGRGPRRVPGLHRRGQAPRRHRAAPEAQAAVGDGRGLRARPEHPRQAPAQRWLPCPPGDPGPAGERAWRGSPREGLPRRSGGNGSKPPRRRRPRRSGSSNGSGGGSRTGNGTGSGNGSRRPEGPGRRAPSRRY